MAQDTAIEWADHTFNPWTGCQKVSPGCDHCYAEGWSKRSGHVEWGPHAERRRTSAANWRQPIIWDRKAAAAGKRARVFCASLADVFDNHPSILPEWRSDLWALIARTPNLDWMLLTKRPGNIAAMLPVRVPLDFEGLYPNVWLGCTVVNQAEADRDIPKLLAVPALVRFLSMEPLLGPVDLTQLRPSASTPWDEESADLNEWGVMKPLRAGPWPPLDWVICGGESGPGARPMHPDWARSLRDQCKAAGVAFFMKQMGGTRKPFAPIPDDLMGRDFPQ